MKVLISEDNDRKFESIKKVVLSVNEKAEITRVTFAKAGVLLLKKEKYNFLIQDMQLPINSDGRIDIKGGIYALKQVIYRDIDVKIAVCSTDKLSYQILKENDLDEIPFIDYSSSYFREDLIKFLSSDGTVKETQHETLIRKYSNNGNVFKFHKIS